MPRNQVNGDVQRPLPKKRNPLLAPDRTQEHSELIKIRRLGQTTLTVPPDMVGNSESTKAENLGPFDYAHLRAPLPENLESSQIFAPQQHQSSPASYFLMRRSRDGFVSATGMFKAAFPWAKHVEEQAEKDHVKDRSSAEHDEVAGNLWVSEHFALELAEEYGIVSWIRALLDPTAIPPASDNQNAKISSPPMFKFSAGDKWNLPPPNGSPARNMRATTPKVRGRPRAGSPEKKASSPQKSTRKPRATKASKGADATTAREASASLQSALNDQASIADSESVNDEKVKVSIESSVETKGDTETTTTNVQIELPNGAPELPMPESMEKVIQDAKEAVETANKKDHGTRSSGVKRKAEAVEDDSDAEGVDAQPAKRPRHLEQAYRRERIRNRSLVGVVAAATIGIAIPYFFG